MDWCRKSLGSTICSALLKRSRSRSRGRSDDGYSLRVYWVASGDVFLRQERFATALNTLSDNWKVGLLLLVPLFYRTIRGFWTNWKGMGSEGIIIQQRRRQRAIPTRSPAARGRGLHKVIMPSRTLGPGKYFTAAYENENEALATIELTSDVPVKTYIVRPKALDLYKQGSRTFKYYGGFPDPRASQNQSVWLPFTGTWYLIIVNPDKSRTADIVYSVSF